MNIHVNWSSGSYCGLSPSEVLCMYEWSFVSFLHVGRSNVRWNAPISSALLLQITSTGDNWPVHHHRLSWPAMERAVSGLVVVLLYLREQSYLTHKESRMSAEISIFGVASSCSTASKKQRWGLQGIELTLKMPSTVPFPQTCHVPRQDPRLAMSLQEAWYVGEFSSRLNMLTNMFLASVGEIRPV